MPKASDLLLLVRARLRTVPTLTMAIIIRTPIESVWPPLCPPSLPQLDYSPFKVQELGVTYQHELEAYLSTPRASDLFSLLRARLRADPALTQRCFDTCATDTDKNALTGEQVRGRGGCWQVAVSIVD